MRRLRFPSLSGTAAARDVAARLRNDDHGAIAAAVAVMLVFLLAFTAFAFDFGAMHLERRELQNAADAAALAAAQDCAEGDCAAIQTTADTYAAANVAYMDGDAAVTAAAQQVTVDGTPAVRVDTKSTIALTFAQLPPISRSTATIGASATAGWLQPSALTPTLPLTISTCEWETSTGLAVGEGFPAGTEFGETEVTLIFHKGDQGNNTDQGNGTDDGAADPGCPVASAWQDSDGDDWVPGGFGWLSGAEDCEVTITADGWATRDPGVNPECRDGLVVGETVLVPVYGDASCGPGETCEDAGHGQIDSYHIAGFGAFVITGYRFAGEVDYSLTSKTCADVGTGNSASCLIGYFTAWVDLGDATTPAEPGDDPLDFGLHVIRLLD